MSTITANQTITNAQANALGWPITIGNGANPNVTVKLDGNFAMDANTKYFIIGGVDCALDGQLNTCTVTVEGWPGLVQNGTNGVNGKNCTVKDIIVTVPSYIYYTNSKQGWLASGYFSRGATSTICGCSVIGTVSTARDDCGGIVGHACAQGGGNLTIKKCFYTGIISKWKTGGIVGTHAANNGSLTMIDCYANGTIGNSSDYAGCIAGEYAASSGGSVTMTRVYSYGSVNNWAAGGIFGRHAGITGGTITLNNVYTYGTMSNGRTIGYNVDATLNINNSYFPKAGNAAGAYNLNGGSTNEVNVDYTSTGGNWDATDAGATIGKAGTPGENKWTTGVTPWTLSAYAGGGGCGDPYIRTFDGELYKLDNINGFCRMIQGNIDSKNFVLNVEMKIDSKETENNMNEWANSLPVFKQIHETESTDQKMQSFFTRVYIEYGKSKLLFNFENFSTVYSEGDEIVYTDSHITSGSPLIDIYKSNRPDKVGIVHCGSVRVYLRRYPNKQIRSEVVILNHGNIENSYGFVTMPMRTKNCRVNKLNDSRMIKRLDKKPSYKETYEETFLEMFDDNTLNTKVMKINSF